MSLQPLAAPTTKLVDKVKNRVQAVERRSLVIEPQWTARSQNISINLILKSEMKGNIKISSLLIPFLFLLNIITAGFLMTGLCHTDSTDGAGQDEVDKDGDDKEEEEDK